MRQLFAVVLPQHACVACSDHIEAPGLEQRSNQNRHVFIQVQLRFVLPANAANLAVYRRYTPHQPWTRLIELASGRFFNGVEAARFDYAAGVAWVSVAFGGESDDIYLAVVDASGAPAPAQFDGISAYYVDPGGYSNATLRAKLAEYNYLVERSVYQNVQDFAPWSAGDGLYERVGVTLCGDQRTLLEPGHGLLLGQAAARHLPPLHAPLPARLVRWLAHQAAHRPHQGQERTLVRRIRPALPLPLRAGKRPGHRDPLVAAELTVLVPARASRRALS